MAQGIMKKNWNILLEDTCMAYIANFRATNKKAKKKV